MGFFDDLIGGIIGIATAPVIAVSDFFSSFDPVAAASDVAHALVTMAQFGYQAITNFAALVSTALDTLGDNILLSIRELAEVVILKVVEFTQTMINGLLEIFGFLTDWANRIYSGFRTSINDMAIEIESHVTQFAVGVTDKVGKLLAVNTVMTILKHGAETGTFGMKTIKQAAFGGISTYFVGEILKGLIQ
jgi:hypothetical protein